MQQSLVIERTISAPADRVWQALTQEEELKQWQPFFPEFRAEVGFETHFLLGRDPEHQYKHVCRVTEVEPGRKLTYTWGYDDYAGNSLVTFELAEEGQQTRLTLTHRITEPFPADNPDFAAKNFVMGWNFTADGLKAFVERSNKQEVS